MKRWIGLLVLALGVCGFIFTAAQKRKLEAARAGIDQGASLFSKNPFAKAAGDLLQHRVNQYDMPILLCFVGSGALVVIGAGMLLISCKKK